MEEAGGVYLPLLVFLLLIYIKSSSRSGALVFWKSEVKRGGEFSRCTLHLFEIGFDVEV